MLDGVDDVPPTRDGRQPLAFVFMLLIRRSVVSISDGRDLRSANLELRQ
jgi:hypothetical protein